MSSDGDPSKPSELVFNIGEVINGYTLVSKIDEGGFGQVYKVSKDNEMYAMKLEPSAMAGGSAIKLEIDVLRGLPPNSVFPAMFNGGRRPKYHFLVLELLGDNLKTLKTKSPKPGAFSESTWSRVGIQCLYALKQMHDAGFVHRDVKPTNFAVGLNPHNCRRILLFDYGLARRFIKLPPALKAKPSALSAVPRGVNSKLKRPSKIVHARIMTAHQQAREAKKPQTASNRKTGMEFRKPRRRTDFRGTELYASPNAHQLKELGRTDDVWSMLYMVAEFFKELPWSAQSETPTGDIKNQCTLVTLFEEFLGCEKPPNRATNPMVGQLEEMDEMLKKRNYYQIPDYQMVYNFLNAVKTKSGVKWSDPYDWEKAEVAASAERKLRSSESEHLWENPKGFFQTDVWAPLRVPEAAASTPESAKQSNGKVTRKSSKEEMSGNLDDEKATQTVETPPQKETPQREKQEKQDSKGKADTAVSQETGLSGKKE